MTENNPDNLSESPLVSIIVITYNSSKYVLETLESAKAQTYQNIELIISDDASTDDTVEVCRQWVEQNKDRFVRTEIITVPENTGIPANCNRGVKASKGEWVKLIAGDDALLKHTITSYVSFVLRQKTVKICHAKSYVFHERFSNSTLLRIAPRKSLFNSDKITPSDQFEILKLKCPIEASTTFIKKELLVKIGGFDESFEIEDWPMWIKITLSKEKIYFFDKIQTCYRKRRNSITRKKSGKNNGSIFYLKKKKVVYSLLWSHLSTLDKLFYKFLFFRANKLNNSNPGIKLVIFKKATGIPIILFLGIKTYFIKFTKSGCFD